MRNDLSNTAPTVWRISETDQLQKALDALSQTVNSADSRGAVLRLGKGTFDCDLTVNHPFIRVQGEGEMTEILGKVTVYAGAGEVTDMAIRGAGKPYALRVMRNPAPGFLNVARCRFENLFLGATFEGAGDGAVNALEIDGVYLTTFKSVTCAFATENGMLIDSTNINYPSTTLHFENCSFVANALRGAWIKGSLGVCTFKGGNFEQNDLFELQAEGMNNLLLDSVDFETDEALSSVIQMSTVNPAQIRNCSFFSISASKPSLVLLGQSCGGIKVYENRFAGFNAGRIGFFDDRSAGCRAYDNLFADIVPDASGRTDQWIEVART